MKLENIIKRIFNCIIFFFTGILIVLVMCLDMLIITPLSLIPYILFGTKRELFSTFDRFLNNLGDVGFETKEEL